MSVLIVLLVLAVVAALVAVPLVRRRNVLGEVDRFQHARTLTTSWSGSGPVVPKQEQRAADD